MVRTSTLHNYVAKTVKHEYHYIITFKTLTKTMTDARNLTILHHKCDGSYLTNKIWAKVFNF